MKIFKNKLYVFLLTFSVSLSFGQSLKVPDLRKTFNYQQPTEHPQLLSKGFKLLSDTISTHQKKFKYYKPDTNEIIELTFKENGEGDEYLSIIYFLPSESHYKKLISTLAAYQFKYSKRNNRYQQPTSSYSGENIYLNGFTPNNGKEYYSLEYVNYKEKALSGLRPELRNDTEAPPINDSMIKPK